MTNVPSESLLLLSGIPATGKSTFGRHLASRRGFVHYDMERAATWPRPDLHPTWNRSRAAFVTKLKEIHPRVVLDWGFPVGCLPLVRELEAEGVRLVWFSGDIAEARKAFGQRGDGALQDFDAQVAAVAQAGFPSSLGCTVVNTLGANGVFATTEEVEAVLFE